MKTKEAIISLRDAQLKAGHSYNTRKTYRHWLTRYIYGAKDGHHSDLQGFLDDLSTRQRLNPKTVKQALNAMVFFYKQVLDQDPGKLRLPAINRHRNEPTWLHHHEVMDLLSRMRGVPKLQASMLYATGSRINALLTMRLKDVDLHGKTVTFNHDKGGKTRTVRLAESLIPVLSDHIEWVRGKWEADNRQGIIAPSPEPSLERKLGRATFGKLPWYWLFPSQVVREDQRWHATDRGLCKAIAVACEQAGITKRVTAHTFRHSHATALLNRGENIRVIQHQLGHRHVETTEIYTHATAQQRPMSPLDQNVVPFVPQEVGRVRKQS